MKFKPEIIFLGLALIVGSLLRFERLDLNPPSLNWDEVSHGYNAYSLLQTGKDEWGERLPLIFRAFGDYKLPLYIYLTTLPVKLFGLTALGVRFFSAISGTLAILGIYLLVNRLFPQRLVKLNHQQFSLGLVAALLLALFPWHFFLSRIAVEANLSLTLIIWGFALLYGRSAWEKLGGMLLLALSLHTYNSARVFVPLLLISWFWLASKQFKFNWGWLLGGIILLLSAGLMVWQVSTGVGLARYEKLAILSPAKVFELGQKRMESTLPGPLPRLIYNRPIFFVSTVAKNYLNFFSADFIYQTQGAQYQFAIPGVNLLGIPIMVLGLVGFLAVIVGRKEPGMNFVLLWLLLSPLPAALTLDPPQSLRPLYLIAAWTMLAALGGSVYLQLFNSKPRLKLYAAGALVFILVLAFGRYWNNYWQIYRPIYAAAWQDGYRQMWQFVLEQEKQYGYDSVIVTKRLGEPHIFLAFYAPLSPELLWPGGDNIRFAQSDWFWTDRIGKYYFANDWDIIPTVKETIKLESGGTIPIGRTLVVASPGQLPGSVAKIKEISDLAGNVVFEIGERR